jgi:hypothetical protein
MSSSGGGGIILSKIEALKVRDLVIAALAASNQPPGPVIRDVLDRIEALLTAP